MWRSWLAYTSGGREVAGSSPVTPTNKSPLRAFVVLVLITFKSRLSQNTIMSFNNNTSLIFYSEETSSKKDCPDVNELNFSENKEGVAWLNTYGLRHIEEMTAVVESNHWDPFLIKLILDQEHSVRVDSSLYLQY